MRLVTIVAGLGALVGVLLGVSSASAIVLGGKGAPQAEHCVAVGGTNVTSSSGGSMCQLPSGQSCEAMALFRDGACVDENGEVVDEGEDFGSNDGSDTGGDGDGGDSGGGD